MKVDDQDGGVITDDKIRLTRHGAVGLSQMSLVNFTRLMSFPELLDNSKESTVAWLKGYKARFDTPSKEVIETFLVGDDAPNQIREDMREIITRHHGSLPDYVVEADLAQLDRFKPQSPLPSWEDTRSQVVAELNLARDERRYVGHAAANLTGKLLTRYIDTSGRYDLSLSMESLPGRTNSGWRLYRVKRFVRDPELAAAAEIWSSKWKDITPIYTLFSRAKLSEDDVTRRSVWGAQFIWNIIEGPFALRAYNGAAAHKVSPFQTWKGIDVLEETMFRNLENLPNGFEYFSFDASGFDIHVTNNQINSLEYALREQFTERVSGEMERAFHSMRNTARITPDGLFTPRAGSIASGHRLTNWMDSCLNLMVLVAIYQEIGVSNMDIIRFVQGGLVQVNGDDMVFPIPKGVTTEEISSLYTEFGWVVNPEKQHRSTEFAYLNSLFFIKGEERAIKPAKTVSIFYPERKFRSTPGPAGHAMATLMRLESLRGHPAKRDLLEYLIPRDKKYGLGSQSERALRAVISASDVLKEVTEIDPAEGYRGSYTLRGVDNWDVVRWLRDRH